MAALVMTITRMWSMKGYVVNKSKANKMMSILRISSSQVTVIFFCNKYHQLITQSVNCDHYLAYYFSFKIMSFEGSIDLAKNTNP